MTNTACPDFGSHLENAFDLWKMNHPGQEPTRDESEAIELTAAYLRSHDQSDLADKIAGGLPSAG